MFVSIYLSIATGMIIPDKFARERSILKFSFKNLLPDSSRLYAKQMCKLPHSKVKVIEIGQRPHVQNWCLFNAISVPGLTLKYFTFMYI